MFKEDNVLSYPQQAALGTAAPEMPVTGVSDQAMSQRLLAHILKSLDDDIAEDVIEIDLRGKSEMADFMVICSGRSSRQVSSISQKLKDRLKQDLGVSSKLEGKDAGDWVLVDAGDVIVHVFRPEVREFYQLEKMWMPSRDSAARN